MKNASTLPAFLSVADSPEAEELRRTTENTRAHGRMIGLIRFQAQRVFDAGMQMIDAGEDPETVANDIVKELQAALPAAEGAALFYIQATIGSLQTALANTESESINLAS